MIFIAGLLLALWFLANYFKSSDLSLTLKTYHVILLIVLMPVIGIIAAQLWSYYLQVIVQEKFSLSINLLNVSISLIAKYIPGKIWGIAARVLIYKKINLEPSKIIIASVYEIYCGTLIVILLGLILYTGATLNLVAALYVTFVLLGVVLIYLLIKLFPNLANLILKFFSKEITIPEHTRISTQNIINIIIGNFLYWLIFTAVIVIFCYVINLDHNGYIVLGLIGAYMASVGAGFLVVFAPGGLFVRESVFVLLCQNFVDISTLLQLAALLRGWVCLYEVVYGFAGYILFTKLNVNGNNKTA